jgi:gluconolactonase
MDLPLETVATGLRFPEGPVWQADGSVLLVEIERGVVSRVAPDGAVDVVADVGGGPNGLAIGPGGALFVCNNGGRFTYHERDGLLIPGHAPPEHVGGSIQRVDLKTGRVETLYEACDGKRLMAPNDIVFDAGGGFWFTDHGWANGEGTRFGALNWAKADGSKIVRAETLPTPNGVGLSPDGKVVYVADTMSGRLWGYEITGEGRVADGVFPGWRGWVVATMPGFQLFDSLAVEADGRICVATILNGGITAITPKGEHEHVAVPDMIVTNICFGGADRRDAWITASGTGVLYKTRWPRPGLKLNFGD